MLTQLIRLALDNRFLVVAATLLMAAPGLNAALNIPIDAVPDMTNVQVAVITEAGSLSPVAEAGGKPVPLKELADIRVEETPPSVEHDSNRRRTYVSANVRGQDVATFVAEAQKAVESSVAVAASGGVFALKLRDMPFSISAGVGFIALFGVAVLNGLVWVSAAEHSRKHGMTLDQAIRETALSRLRPVLMTALVAGLGFLPMALSQSDGAEMQRPLASVVIGGLITSTLLTSLVVPAIYPWFARGLSAEKNNAAVELTS